MIKKHRLFSAFCVFVMALTVFSGFTISAQELPFSDIARHWAKTDILKAAKSNIIKGYNDGTFKPEGKVTRAEFVSMLVHLLKLKDENIVELEFEDVKKTDWYYNVLQKAIFSKFIFGTGKTTFEPNLELSRQDAAVILTRVVPTSSKTVNLNIFSDVGLIESWAKSSVSNMIAKGYMQGTSDTLFEPNASLTRAQAAKLIVKIIDNEKIITADTIVTSESKSLENKIFVGDLYIEITDTEDNLGWTFPVKSISALAQMYTDGKGTGSLQIKDSHISRLAICQQEGSMNVSLRGATTVYETIIFNKNHIEEYDITARGFVDTVFTRGDINFTNAVEIVKLVNSAIKEGKTFSDDLVKDCVMVVIDSGYME